MARSTKSASSVSGQPDALKKQREICQRVWENLSRRGVLCESWQNFDRFFEDIEKPEYERVHLVRPDEGKPFGPKNYVWADSAYYYDERVRWKGQSKSIDQWALELGLTPATIYSRLRRGMSMNQIAKMPKEPGRPKKAIGVDHDAFAERMLKLAKRLV
jgi:hypothetical protein